MDDQPDAMAKDIGLPPGTLVHVGKARSDRVGITVMDYTEGELAEREVASVDECLPYKDSPTVTWINVDGVHNLELVRELGHKFGVHPLVLEDIVNTTQRPKSEAYDTCLFTVLKMLYWDEAAGAIAAEQVSVLLGPQVVLSFQEQPGDVFDRVRERIRQSKGRIRSMGADYLAYSLVDAVVDNYFVILEWLGERIEALEDRIDADAGPEAAKIIRGLKKEMLAGRKAIWPLRDVVSALVRGESPLIRADTLPFFRDVYDHVIQVIDTAETYRERLSSLRDAYLAALSNKMNEVMKVLTMIATLFIPLTFLAGIYGMNFAFMPELKWRWGYPGVLGAMLLVAGGMVVYFKRKRWI